MIKFGFIFLFFAAGVFAQANKTDINIRKQIEKHNDTFGASFIEGNKNALLNAYSEESILMPEHSRQRIGVQSIADFFSQWLSQAKVNSFQKTILDLQDFGSYVLEIGNFTEELTTKEQNPYSYSGKYAVLWKKQSNNKKPFTIAAEIWGSSRYFDDKSIPNIDDSAITLSQEYRSSDKTTVEVKARNETIKMLVKNRLGAEHAKLFMPDAMYLTYYNPILSGEKEIAAYFIEHEKPGTLQIEQISIQTFKIINTKNAVIEFGFYNVNWRDGESYGNVKGKSINIWKRDNKGELMLFRQIVNHD